MASRSTKKSESDKNRTTEPNFFHRLRTLARDTETGCKEIECLLAANKNEDKDVLASKARIVLQCVAGEIEDVRLNCEYLLCQLRDDCIHLEDTVNNMRSLVMKQRELSSFYASELSKYGYTAIEANKEEILQKENSADHIKSGLTSVAYFEKDSMPGDFHHNGLLVTPGLFPDHENGTYFYSPTVDTPNDGTFVIELRKEDVGVLHQVELPTEPKMLSAMELCTMKLPEEPVLLSKQPRKALALRTLGKRENYDIADKPMFDPTDPMTPLPPEPVMRSQSINRSIAHGIKKMNLDDADSDEEPSQNDAGSALEVLPPGPIHSSKNPNRFMCGFEMPDTPELVSMKYYPSSKLLATIRQNHEAEAGDIANATLQESDVKTDEENSGKERSVNGMGKTAEMKLLMQPVVHGTQDNKPASLTDPKSAAAPSVMSIPPSPQLLSKPPTKFQYDEIKTLSDTGAPQATELSSGEYFYIRVINETEYCKLPESLRSVVSAVRMNRCVDNINDYLRRKTVPILTLGEIRDDIGFGRHAKDVIVFLLELGRIDIHKRCSKNPSYILL